MLPNVLGPMSYLTHRNILKKLAQKSSQTEIANTFELK